MRKKWLQETSSALFPHEFFELSHYRRPADEAEAARAVSAF